MKAMAKRLRGVRLFNQVAYAGGKTGVCETKGTLI